MHDKIVIERITAVSLAAAPPWAAVRELCCRTGDDGAAIPADRWQEFANIWIEPYREYLPDWTYLALADGQLVGYLTGCPDSASFARQHLGVANNVARHFPQSVRRRIADSFPAHLHMNIDAGHRRGGVGTSLLQKYIDGLRQARIAGVHLFCGSAPVPFYRRNGFSELTAAQARGHNVHAMVLSL